MNKAIKIIDLYIKATKKDLKMSQTQQEQLLSLYLLSELTFLRRDILK